MTKDRNSLEKLIDALQERAQELNCLYAIEEVLKQRDAAPDDVFRQVIDVIPPGWQYPEVCQARITYEEKHYQPPDYIETPWVQQADIVAQERVVGSIEVSYREEMPPEDDGPFLKEEARLIRTIADRLGHYILHYQLQQVFDEWDTARKEVADHPEGEEVHYIEPGRTPAFVNRSGHSGIPTRRPIHRLPPRRCPV